MLRTMASVLVIDSTPGLRDAVVSALGSAGHAVTLCDDGVDGLEVARREAFDLIALDLLTTRIHGFELLQALRTHFSTLRTPLVAYTDKIYPSDQREAAALGADQVVDRLLGPGPVVAAIEEELAALRVTFWGVRGSIASPGPETVRYGGNTPCVTLTYGRRTLILDAGSGIRRLGLVMQAEARGKPLEIDLLVTHTHWDHIQGFPFFVPAYVKGNTVRVHGPRSLSKPLEKVLRGQMDAEYFPVALGDMLSDVSVHDIREQALEIGPFRVSHTYMNHPSITLGYRVEAGGRAVTYATDTEPFGRLLGSMGSAATVETRRTLDQRLVDLARDSDLCIADAQYTAAEYKSRVGWGHSASEDAVELAVHAGAKRLALFSHDPMQDDDSVDTKVEQARALARTLLPGAPPEVFGAREGQVVRL